ncbi:hypothetical protein PPIS_a4562 [Pseudoalteromonas piscicida]|uniref:Uncharacterized protein n=1 Tax=Pseudoalteromonas piscicida TaxID=43662 RepID=A0ABN5CKJ2_PSEO7|nr:hypothetical protein PPIS_a4562 [Pseudoalteromonas piscicida]
MLIFWCNGLFLNLKPNENGVSLPSLADIKARPCASRSFFLNDEKERTKKTSPQHHT